MNQGIHTHWCRHTSINNLTCQWKKLLLSITVRVTFLLLDAELHSEFAKNKS